MEATCALCGATKHHPDLDPGDEPLSDADFCYGCRETVCNRHDSVPGVGRHDVSEHPHSDMLGDDD